MKILQTITVLAALVYACAAKQNILQENLGEAGPRPFELASLSHQELTAFSHPVFPGRSLRIKKSKFCDGGVNAYTGYIDVNANHFFFYFFESRNDPDTDDVVLWTNGGPGGSSTMGLFLELGPCTIASANSTTYNPYSWNSNANIFFIDQPIGVGFSYNDFGEIPSTSEEAGKHIAAFMAIFFETFTQFRGRAFHLTGESYAGRYLPVYAAEIYDQNAFLVENGLAPINLKSVAIGNGATEFHYLLRSYYDVQCTDAAVAPVQSISNCIRMKQIVPRCERLTKASCYDHFDLIDCRAVFDFCMSELAMPYINAGYNYYDITKKCDTDTNCYPQRKNVSAYLDDPQNRILLGVDAACGKFKESSTDVYNAFWTSGDPLHPTQLYIAEVLHRGVKVLIYAGSYDFIANWVGNLRWTIDMEWTGQAGYGAAEMREWLVNGKPAGNTKKFGNLTFATIYGAGHLVPHDKPVESLAMIERWLAEESL